MNGLPGGRAAVQLEAQDLALERVRGPASRGWSTAPGAPPSPMPVSPTETHSLPSGPIRSVPPSWLPPSVRMPVSSSVRLPATTVLPDIVTRTTWLKRPVELAQPPAAGLVRYR